jgi:hypothetical protein
MIPLVLYKIYIVAIPLIILASLFGFRWKVGLWGNCLTCGAVLFSFLIAAGWWEDAAALIAGQAPALLFVADCVAFWTIFVVSLLILDTATRFISTVKVQYAGLVESIGNGIVIFFLCMALYGTFLFAEDIGPVGARIDDAVPRDSGEIHMLRILSAGNLSGFSQGNQFDDTGKFRELQLQRRQAIMYNVLEKEGSITYSGNVPGRQGK